MALPIAHCSVALGLARSVSFRTACLICLICLLPDFDFGLALAGWPLASVHRTFSHSLLFTALLTLLWARAWPARWRLISPGLFFAVLASHSVIDLLCTADRFDHGVMLFWPLSDVRLGWPVLVPLYRLLGESPFSLQGAILFTALEAALAWPFWKIAQTVAELGRQLHRAVNRKARLAEADQSPEF